MRPAERPSVAGGVDSLADAAIVALGDVGSTNDEAMARLRDTGAAVWVTAARQLAGRGRRGRAWTSEPGNLYASLAFPCTLETDAFGLLPLAAAVAVGDALAALGLAPQLKWPNDVLVGGAKVAGILVEAEGTDPRRVVVGIGVNVAHHPEPADAPAPTVPATHLAAHRPGVVAADVLAALRPALAAAVADLGRPDGAAAIRGRWLERAFGIGAPIAVRFERETREGTFAGLDPTGRLILKSGDRTDAIAAGDVFVRSPA